MLEAAKELADNNKVHIDLKPGNMIIDSNGVIKLIDFNSAKIYGSPNKKHS